MTRIQTWAGILVALVAVLLVGTLAYADRNEESYKRMHFAPAVIRGGALDGADSLDKTSPLSTAAATLSIFSTHGNPTVAVRADFSISGATSTLSCVLFNLTASSTYTFAGVAGVQTATGGTGTADGTLFDSPLLFFDTAGSSHYEIRKTDPSDSSTVTLTPFSYGANSQGAQ